MKNKTVYCVSFNVGSEEVWRSELHSNQEAAFLEVKNSKDEISAQISCFSYAYSSDGEETFEMIDRAILQLKQKGYFKDKENELDFFVLEQNVL